MNIGDWIERRALIRPDQPFLQDRDKIYNNRQFNERVDRTAAALIHAGVSKGDRAALLMANCSEFLEIFFACAKTGIIMVPLNFRLAVPELSFILADAEPKLLIYDAEFAEQVQALKAALAIPMHYLCRGGDGTAADPSFGDLVDIVLTNEQVVGSSVDLTSVDQKDPLFIMYTAGTTGDPKGAVLTHENILFGAIHSLLGYGVDRSYKSLVVGPLFHIGALAASVTPIIYAGGSIVISNFYSASETLARIVRERINYMFAVPVMFQLMTETKEWPDADLSHVHFFISGGAPIPLPVIKKYQEEKGIGSSRATP